MTAPLDLDALEAAARAAGADCWYVERDAKDCFDTNIEEDIAYIIAASPAAVLALIERLRAAEASADKWHRRADHAENLVSPCKPTMEGQISMVLTTMRGGRLLHAVQHIHPQQLMLQKDGGLAIVKHNAARMMMEISEVPHG